MNLSLQEYINACNLVDDWASKVDSYQRQLESIKTELDNIQAKQDEIDRAYTKREQTVPAEPGDDVLDLILASEAKKALDLRKLKYEVTQKKIWAETMQNKLEKAVLDFEIEHNAQ